MVLCFITVNKTSRHKNVDYFEDDDYVTLEKSVSSNFDHTKSYVFKNNTSDHGVKSFNNESTQSNRLRGGSQPFMNRGGHRGSYESSSSRFGRASQTSMDDEANNRFSGDLELKVNSGDIGRIIGMLILTFYH